MLGGKKPTCPGVAGAIITKASGGGLIAITPQTHNSPPCPQTAVMETFQPTQNGLLVIAMKTEMNQEKRRREHPALADPLLCVFVHN